MLTNKNILKTLVNIFFVILFMELFLMGSGRYFEVGPLTLRMILYFIAVSIAFLLYLHISKIDKKVLTFLAIFIFILSFSSLMGLLNGASPSFIMQDIKPLLFFLTILPFTLFINSLKSIVLISHLIKLSAFIMAMLYMLWLGLMFFGYLDFNSMHELLSSDSNDIMFRGADSSEAGLFYKGFAYMCIGFIFFVYSKGYKNKTIALIILIAIILTFTRGFVVALVFAFTYKSIVDYKKKKSLIFLGLTLIFLAIAIPYYMANVGIKETSDAIRILQIHQVLDNVTFLSFFIGHGFGIGVDIRPHGMEISYLEIFHKQGIMGLLFWFSLLYLITINYINITEKTSLVISLFVGSLFIFMQSLTNPFINNPIGMSMILISFISLEFIQKNQKAIYE